MGLGWTGPLSFWDTGRDHIKLAIYYLSHPIIYEIKIYLHMEMQSFFKQIKLNLILQTWKIVLDDCALTINALMPLSLYNLSFLIIIAISCNFHWAYH